MVAPVAGMRSLVVVMRQVNQTDTADPASLSAYWTPVKHPAAHPRRPDDQHGQAHGPRAPRAAIRSADRSLWPTPRHRPTRRTARTSPRSGHPATAPGMRTHGLPGGRRSRAGRPGPCGRAGREPGPGPDGQETAAARRADPCGRGQAATATPGGRPPPGRQDPGAGRPVQEPSARKPRNLQPATARPLGPQAQETAAGHGRARGPGGRVAGGGVGVEGGLRRNRVTACLMP